MNVRVNYGKLRMNNNAKLKVRYPNMKKYSNNLI